VCINNGLFGGITLKRIIAFIAAAVFAAGCLTSCAPGAETPDTEKKEAISIVTTIFPEYDWVNSILGSNPAGAEVTFLLDNGVDLHSYQPTAEDMLKISTCDLFIYVGGESDEWTEDVLENAANEEMEVINLLELLGDAVKEEEVVEGMEHDHDHDHDHEDGEEEHDHEEDHDHEDGEEEHDHDHEEGEAEMDEHVWLSLRNAAVLVDGIEKAIEAIDPGNAETYRDNASEYIGKLNALDAEYTKTVSAAETDVLLFGDRFPFRYLTDDYGLGYYAAFVGCSAETEASFETVAFLAAKVDELSLGSVMIIESSDGKIAQTIVANTEDKDQKILTLDSLQSTTAQDAEKGVTYLSVMENNLSVLKEALK